MAEANTKDIADLGRRYGACEDAIQWAINECADAGEIWQKSNPERLIWIATQHGILTDEQLAAFAQWGLIATPPPKADVDRIRACLDGTDNLTYPGNCSRARWAALAIAARGKLPVGDVAQTREAQAHQLRKIAPQPFVTLVEASDFE